MTHVQVLLRDSKSHNKRDLEGFRHGVSKKRGKKGRREGPSEVFAHATTKSFLSSAAIHLSFCSDVPSSGPLIVSGLHLMCK